MKSKVLPLLAAATLVAASSLHAATVVETGASGSDLSLASSWTGSVLPGSGDLAQFTNASNAGALSGAASYTVGGPITWGQLGFESGITGANTLGGSTITIANTGANGVENKSAQAVTIGNDLVFSGASARISATGAGALTLGNLTSTATAAGTELVLRGTGVNGVVNGVITTTGSTVLAKTDAGTWALNGANSIAAGVNFKAGTLLVGNDGAFGSGTVTTGNTINSVSLTLGATSGSGARSLANNFVLGGGALNTLSVNTTNAAITLAGTIAGSSTGKKTLSVTGVNNASFTNTISDSTTTGTTSLSSNFAAAATTITLDSVDGITVGSTITGTGIAGGTTITAINAGTRVVTLSAATSGSGSFGSTYTVSGVKNLTYLTKSGAGTLTLSGLNTYTGGTTVSGGTLAITSTGQVVVNGASGINITAGALTVDGTLKLTSGAATIANATATAITLNGVSSVLDIGSFFNAQADGSTYQLITGTTKSTTGTFSSILFDTNAFSAVTFNNSTGTLSFAAVPEPSTYGLIGAGALAALSVVRRRRKHAIDVA